MAKDGKGAVLCGMNEICKVVGNVSADTVLKWKNEYTSFPIEKLGGQWVGYRDAILKWWRDFSEGKIQKGEAKKISKKDLKKNLLSV